MPKFKNGLARVGKVYYYCIRVNGTQYKGSTRATDRATAEKVLEVRRREILLGPEIKPLPMPTVCGLVGTWLTTYQSTYSPRHIESVEGFARVWINPEIGKLQIDQVTTQAVLALRKKILEAGRSPATANLMLRILKLLMSFAIRLGHIQSKPFNVSPLRLQKKPRPTVPAGSMAEFLNACETVSKNPQVGVMLATMVGLGLRESELLGMRFEWLDTEQRTYQIGKAKGKDARIVPIPDWVSTRLSKLSMQTSPWIFSNSEGQPYRRGHLRHPLDRVCKLLNIKRLSQHRLRATFASLHSISGTPVIDIQQMLGHRTIQVTLGYIETSLDAKRKAQDTLSLKLGLV